jgi:integrase
MADIKLTKRTVDALKPRGDGRPLFAWDREQRGFGVRVLPTGRKVFVLQYRPTGARIARRMTLGAYGPLTVDNARTLAKRHLGAIADGADPARERSRARRAPTVRELGLDYLADVDARRKLTTAREYRRLWEKHVLPALGTTKVSAVTLADVARLHRRMRAKPYLGNRVLAMLGAFFTFAEREGVCAPRENPAHGVDFYPERARERFLTPAEFAALGEALARAERDGLPPAPVHRRRPKSDATIRHRAAAWDVPRPANSYAVAAIRLLALTGCREGEVLSLRWDAVDLERGHLRLADTKTGRSVRPLSAAALALLDTLPRLMRSPYVFPGASPDAHLKEIKRLWFAVRHAAGLEGVRLHDLRHSFASVSAMGGDSLIIIRALLGHADVATTERYAHLGDDPLKAAADRTASAIEGWMSGRRSGTVKLRRSVSR